MKQFLATLGMVAAMFVLNVHAWDDAAIKCDTAGDVRSVMSSIKSDDAYDAQRVFNKKLFAGKCGFVRGASQYTLGEFVPNLSWEWIGQKIRIRYRVHKIITPRKFEGHYLIRQSVEPVISTPRA